MGTDVSEAQKQKAIAFGNLHVKGDPVVLYNIWDAGSAKTVVGEGAKAVATGSWSVASAHGYPDGQAIPLDLLLQVVERIVCSVDVPVSIDYEGGYAEQPEGLAVTIERLIGSGAIGCNFEDQIVGGKGLYSVSIQAERIRAIRQTANEHDLKFVINARTDLFLKEPDQSRHANLMDDAIERAHAYADAGASCFFVPALMNKDLIAKMCEASPLPVNVMALRGMASIADLAKVGIARVSYGPAPYRQSMKRLKEDYQASLSD